MIQTTLYYMKEITLVEHMAVLFAQNILPILQLTLVKAKVWKSHNFGMTSIH